MNGHRATASSAAVLLLFILLFFPGCGSEKEYTENLVQTFDKAKATGTAGDMKAIGSALSVYRIDHGDYPSASGIDAVVTALSPDYLRTAVRQDKWGQPFLYSAGPAGYRLVSLGEDGREGTEDDLVLEDGRLTKTPPGFGFAF